MSQKRGPIIVIFVIAAVFGVSWLSGRLASREPAPEELICILDVRRHADTTKGFIFGYNYYLLERYASEHGRTASTRLAVTGENAADSVLAGVADIVVLPYDGAPVPEGMRIVESPDSMCIWGVRESAVELSREAAKFLERWCADEAHDSTLAVFLDVYNPYYRRGVKSYISPYDSLFKAAGEAHGFDWHLVAAIAYQESNFRIEASSRKGAEGLMQLTPVTAKFVGLENVLDPAQNIEHGTAYLERMWRHFHSVRDPRERLKFSLASYNAGYGHIRDCINYARFAGKPHAKWDDIVEIIPEFNMEHVQALDTVKTGRFRGLETIAYVDGILSLEKEFNRICP